MLSAIHSFTSKSCELAYDVHYICTVALWIGVWPNKIKFHKRGQFHVINCDGTNFQLRLVDT